MDCVNDGGEKCRIPFVHEGKTYYSCKIDKGYDHWCSEKKEFEYYQWDYCSDPKCRKLSHETPNKPYQKMIYTFF